MQCTQSDESVSGCVFYCVALAFTKLSRDLNDNFDDHRNLIIIVLGLLNDSPIHRLLLSLRTVTYLSRNF